MVSQRHFQSSKSDNFLFCEWQNGHLLLVLVYIDDIIITDSSSLMVQQVIQAIQQTFGLKDLRELNSFLGIEVTKVQDRIHMSHAKIHWCYPGQKCHGQLQSSTYT